MSSTPSNTVRLSSANGAAPRIAAKSSSTSQASIEAIATICCARMSSGLRGIAGRLDRPVVHRLGSRAAQATRSPRNFGKMTPSLGASTWWPPRPMRCRPLATDGGASIWTTRSIAPMSMPSSSDDVATSARRRAGLQQRPRSRLRWARAIEPWCERTSVSPASSFSAPASRSASRRLLTKMQRRAVRANQLEQPRVDRRPDRARTCPCAAGPEGISIGSPMRAMSSTGTSMRSSRVRRVPASTMVTGR